MKTAAADPIRDDTVLQHSLMIDDSDVSSEMHHEAAFYVVLSSWYDRRVLRRGIIMVLALTCISV